ncbi:hypothetical protein BTVI_157064 [Pitangus sulphuratus]|nr:hypothetical protein BTVI_157064 [Pitangus sulphuratus]
MAQGLFHQVLEAMQHCTSHRVLHHNIRAENIIHCRDEADGLLLWHISKGHAVCLLFRFHPFNRDEDIILGQLLLLLWLSQAAKVWRSACNIGHNCGILQHDMKLENIIFNLATGRAKLLDFGDTFFEDTLYTQMKSRYVHFWCGGHAPGPKHHRAHLDWTLEVPCFAVVEQD